MSNTDDSGPGSFRQAIIESNADLGHTNQIAFDIGSGGLALILPATPLPAITNSVFIDGWSQPGFNGTPLVELSGSQAGDADGLTITGPNVTVRGLDIEGFSSGSGILIWGADAKGDSIYGDFLGTDATGTEAQPNLYGIQIVEAASDNSVGGTTSGTANVISRNGSDGVVIDGTGTTGNVVEGNEIGTDVTGSTVTGSDGNSLGNGNDGILIDAGASGNTIGGTTEGAGDVISGNGNDGVAITGALATGNVIEGNEIGTDKTGTTAYDDNANPLGNSYDGIYIASGASNNTIGGTTAGARNVISGNTYDGVLFIDAGTSGNVVEGNDIGTSAAGDTAYDANGKSLGNGYEGVSIDNGASDNTVGGTVFGARNVISGNADDGVLLYNGGTNGNVVEGNFIGTDETGTTAFDQNGRPLGNGDDGVAISGGASDNTIGGTTAGVRDLISGNANDGVDIDGTGTTGNVVDGDFIGTDMTGTTTYDNNAASLGNSYDGIYIASGASDNTIGGTTSGARNVISGNLYDGILITDSGTSGNLVEGNDIGTNAAGDSAYGADGKSLGNGNEGVFIYEGASGNTVGGTIAAARNVISGNTFDGVWIYGDGSSANLVAGNFIGTDETGTKVTDSAGRSLANGDDGVAIESAASDNTVGGSTASAANVISGNGNDGVAITGTGTTGNIVVGNFIGTDETGTTAYEGDGHPLGNSYDGVYIAAGASDNTIGGISADARNVISGNIYDGVLIIDTGTSGNVVEGNDIGTSVAGNTAYLPDGKSLGNGDEGVYIDEGASDNTVGGTESGARNIISGNTEDGVWIYGAGTDGNAVEGNFIGTDETGTTAFDQNGHSLGNGDDGVAISAGASDNTVGGTTAAAPTLSPAMRIRVSISTAPGRPETWWWEITLAPAKPVARRTTAMGIAWATFTTESTSVTGRAITQSVAPRWPTATSSPAT